MHYRWSPYANGPGAFEGLADFLTAGSARRRLGSVWPIIRLLWSDERQRVVASLGSMLMFPIAMSYLACRLAHGDGEAQRRYVTAGLSLALASTVLQTGSAILDDRFCGQLQLLRTCPVSKLSYYVARVGYGALKTLSLMFATVVIGFAGGHIAPTAGTLAAVIVTSLTAGTSLCGMAALIGVRASNHDAGQTALALCSIGLALMSPLYYPAQALPHWLATVLLISPYTHLPPQMMAVVSGTGIPLGSVCSALVIGAFFNLLGYRGLAW